MNKPLTIALAAAAALAAPAAAADDHTATEGEVKLAKLLEGRVAGEPTSCLRSVMANDQLEVIDETALVFGRGSTIWVNVPRTPESLDDSDMLVIRRFGSSLCKQDIVTTADRATGMYSGNVFLGDFVPYRKQ